MRYAIFDQQGRVDSAHNDDTVLELPEGAVELSESQWGDRFNLRLVSGVLSNDPIVRPLEVVKADVFFRVKAERDRRRFNGGVKVGVLWFKSDQLATGEYTALALIGAPLPEATVLRAGWRTMGGGTIDMTPLLVRQILAAGLAAVAAIDDVAQAHMTALATCEDPAAYDFSSGWPPVFGE